MTRQLLRFSAVLLVACSVSGAREGNDQTAGPTTTPRRSDLSALHGIFGDASLNANARALAGKSQQLSPADRLLLLADWVLPTPAHPTFRLNGCFENTAPSPLHRIAATDDTQSAVATEPTPQAADGLICPAMALVRTAHQQGQLDVLQERVLASKVGDPVQAYRQVCLLFLIAAEGGDFEAAGKAFDELFRMSETLDRTHLDVRWPVVLILRAALRSPELRRMVGEPLFALYIDARRWSPDKRFDLINDHICSLAGQYQQLDSNGRVARTLPASSASTQWVPFGYADAETRGSGRPTSLWTIGKGTARHISGHEVDYLSYHSPLQGEYEVECDFSTLDGEHVAFMVAGSSVEAFDGQGMLRVSTYRQDSHDVAAGRPLTPFEPWARYRAVVRNSVLTQAFNGAPVLTRELPAGCNPWIAVRMWRRSHGRVRDLRITGEPVIPHELCLTADPQLPGWIPYFAPEFDSDKTTWHGLIEDGDIAIVGPHRPELSGSHLQRLLRYCRPMMEDGTIEFDYFYSPDRFAVHPALDRLALVLEPSGVRVHWITDGRFERGEIDPANVHDEPQHARGSETLPLINDAWNHVSLTLSGANLLVRLNDELVFERPLEASNRRTFGLFHFADRTQARIRKVVWRGEWPRHLPSVDQQQLASNDLDFLSERLPALTAEFRHDLRDGAPTDLFDFNGDQTTLSTVGDGLRAERWGNRQGLLELRACLQVHGDFDITASFSDLEIQMQQPRWNAGIGLRLFLDSPDENALSLYRRVAQHEGNHRLAYYHLRLMPDGTKDTLGDNQVEDSDSGRLRISRRGEWAYGLYAAHDSPNFRLVGRQKVTTDPVAFQGLRLAFQEADSVDIRTTWRSLHIQAERITGLPIANAEPVIARLKARRRQLHDASIDLSNPNIIGNQTSIFASDGATTTITAKGLRMTATSQNRTETAQLQHQLPIGNATDVEAHLKIDRLDVPERMGVHCECTMQVRLENVLRDQNSTVPLEASLLVHQKANGVRDLTARLVFLNRFGKRVWRAIRSVDVDSPDSLRIAIEEEMVYFLYSEAGDDEQHLIATAELDVPTRGRSIHLKTTSNGPGRTSDALWQRLDLHVDRAE